MRKSPILLLMITCVLASCNRDIDYNIGEKDAYIPIYGDDAVYRTVSFQAAKPIVNGGKIVLYNQYLFQMEDGEGIHVFNVSNPSSPQRVGFIKSPLCKQLAIKNNFLITNNLDDMVVVDFSNPLAIKEVKRLTGEFPEMKLQAPSQTNIFFECPDAKKGIVIGWKLGKVTNPKCSQ